MTSTGPQVHHFADSDGAYDACTAGTVQDGDVMVVRGEGIIGALTNGHPIALTEKSGALHPTPERTVLREMNGGKFAATADAAEGIANELGLSLLLRHCTEPAAPAPAADFTPTPWEHGHCTTARGGAVHEVNGYYASGKDFDAMVFPLCRTGGMSSRGTSYRKTGAELTCRNCIGNRERRHEAEAAAAAAVEVEAADVAEVEVTEVTEAAPVEAAPAPAAEWEPGHCVPMMGGAVHEVNGTLDGSEDGGPVHVFPLCRTGSMTNQGTRYRKVEAELTCRNCIGNRERRRAAQARRAAEAAPVEEAPAPAPTFAPGTPVLCADGFTRTVAAPYPTAPGEPEAVRMECGAVWLAENLTPAEDAPVELDEWAARLHMAKTWPNADRFETVRTEGGQLLGLTFGVGLPHNTRYGWIAADSTYGDTLKRTRPEAAALIPAPAPAAPVEDTPATVYAAAQRREAAALARNEETAARARLVLLAAGYGEAAKDRPGFLIRVNWLAVSLYVQNDRGAELTGYPLDDAFDAYTATLEADGWHVDYSKTGYHGSSLTLTPPPAPAGRIEEAPAPAPAAPADGEEPTPRDTAAISYDPPRATHRASGIKAGDQVVIDGETLTVISAEADQITNRHMWLALDGVSAGPLHPLIDDEFTMARKIRRTDVFCEVCSAYAVVEADHATDGVPRRRLCAVCDASTGPDREEILTEIGARLSAIMTWNSNARAFHPVMHGEDPRPVGWTLRIRTGYEVRYGYVAARGLVLDDLTGYRSREAATAALLDHCEAGTDAVPLVEPIAVYLDLLRADKSKAELAELLHHHDVDAVRVQADGPSRFVVTRGGDFLGTIYDAGPASRRGRYEAWSPYAGTRHNLTGFHHSVAAAVDSIEQAWPVAAWEIAEQTGTTFDAVLIAAAQLSSELLASLGPGRDARSVRVALDIAGAVGPDTKIARPAANRLRRRMTGEPEPTAADAGNAPAWLDTSALTPPFRLWGEFTNDGFRHAPADVVPLCDPVTIVKAWRRNGVRYGMTEAGRTVCLWLPGKRHWAEPGA